MAEWVEYMTSPAGTLADERARNGRKTPWKVPYFGIGNELRGCGGNMRPEYAADLTRRYATFIKAPAGTRILKIAAGANVDDYKWTETMIREASGQIDALSLHYYTIPGSWPPRASPTVFDEAGWAETLAGAWKMDELIAKHSAIMDKYDPQKRIWLAVDEWGTWYAQDAGTHPGFLRQQNSLRDALVAAIHLNVFAKHAGRVKMTAIAQMVNVLQAMILTDGPRRGLTLTYHVFQGYAILDNPAMPIIGEGGAEANGTYVKQLQANAQAAVDAVVKLGVGDRGRMAVGGHSYGAFMTANLLAHTDLFRAGIARSGAYNRTLTPFGFQAEQRTYWQATPTYTEMSPFTYADRIKAPILLIHGGADDNSGTFPIQSERM